MIGRFFDKLSDWYIMPIIFFRNFWLWFRRVFWFHFNSILSVQYLIVRRLRHFFMPFHGGFIIATSENVLMLLFSITYINYQVMNSIFPRTFIRNLWNL